MSKPAVIHPTAHLHAVESIGKPYRFESKIDDTLYLLSGGLYLMSGPPASGKSSILSGNPIDKSMIISTDAIRKQLLGSKLVYKEGRRVEFISERVNPQVWSIVKSSVEARLSEGLTTFVDATFIDDVERMEFANLAVKYGVPFRVLITKPQSLESRITSDNLRSKAVGASVIKMAHDAFEVSSQFPHSFIDFDTYIEVVPRQLTSSKVDIVGDVHGLFKELILLLSKAGWTFNPETNEVTHADPERILLFLGDLVDRGYASIAVVNLVRLAVKQGKAICLKGNHERKLASFITQVKAGPLEGWSSYANADTGCQVFKAMADEEVQRFVNFLHYLPTNYVYQSNKGLKFAFVHADTETYDPFTTHAYSMTNGDSGFDRTRICDLEYARNNPTHLLVRGHFPLKDVNDWVVSLDNQGYEKGTVMLLPFDKFVSKIELTCDTPGFYSKAFNECVIQQQSDFSFKASESKFSLIKSFNSLIDEKMVISKTDASGLLKIYKYAARVFYDNLWGSHPALLRARGIVLDLAGNIIANPFTKVFNYGENNTGLNVPDSTKVVAVKKLNGFLGVISWNPFSKSILVTTSGSFESDFVKYINELLTPAQRGKLSQFFNENPNYTFMFEVLHPADPHIVKYPKEMMGLHMIGVRGNKLDDEVLTESEIDVFAQQLGFPRPEWFETTIGEIKAINKACNHEGYMVRLNSVIQEYLFKLKSPFYLTTKFMGRMTEGNIKFMFKSPNEFKKRVDEEFYIIVDECVLVHDINDFLTMTKDERVSAVRELSIKVVS